MAQFSWLHFSDLHLRPQGSRLLNPEYREAFERDLRRLHRYSGPWHLVVITGDLTVTGSKREFELLNSMLDSLWEFFRSLGSNPVLLAVPGDHDVASRAAGPHPAKGLADGTRVLILEIEQVERYAGSLIVSARDNPNGVPALDMARVMSPSMEFPRLLPAERLRRDQELPVLDCVIDLLIEHATSVSACTATSMRIAPTW